MLYNPNNPATPAVLRSCRIRCHAMHYGIPKHRHSQTPKIARAFSAVTTYLDSRPKRPWAVPDASVLVFVDNSITAAARASLVLSMNDLVQGSTTQSVSRKQHHILASCQCEWGVLTSAGDASTMILSYLAHCIIASSLAYNFQVHLSIRLPSRYHSSTDHSDVMTPLYIPATRRRI